MSLGSNTHTHTQACGCRHINACRPAECLSGVCAHAPGKGTGWLSHGVEELIFFKKGGLCGRDTRKAVGKMNVSLGWHKV